MKAKGKSPFKKILPKIRYSNTEKNAFEEKKVTSSSQKEVNNCVIQKVLKTSSKTMNLRHSQHRKKDEDASEYRDSSFYAFQKKKQVEIKEDLRIKSQRELRSVKRSRASETPSPYLKSLAASSSNRPKRTTKKPDYLIFYDGGKTMNGIAQGYDQYLNLNDHTLMRPTKYNDENEQPIEVNLSLESLLLMTIHSHLHSNEIIGYLGGFYTN